MAALMNSTPETATDGSAHQITYEVNDHARLHCGDYNIARQKITFRIDISSLAFRLYKRCKDAPDSCGNISSELLSLHALLLECEEAFSNKPLPENQSQRLALIIRGCTEIFHELEEIVSKYESLRLPQKRTWVRMKWHSEEVNAIRARISSHSSLLSAFFGSSQPRIEKKLNELLKEIRRGNIEGSIITSMNRDSLNLDQREQWRLVRKEFESHGITLEMFDANRDFIFEWFSRAFADNAFESEEEFHMGESGPTASSQVSSLWSEHGANSGLDITGASNGKSVRTTTGNAMHAMKPTPRSNAASSSRAIDLGKQAPPMNLSRSHTPTVSTGFEQKARTPLNTYIFQKHNPPYPIDSDLSTMINNTSGSDRFTARLSLSRHTENNSAGTLLPDTVSIAYGGDQEISRVVVPPPTLSTALTLPSNPVHHIDRAFRFDESSKQHKDRVLACMQDQSTRKRLSRESLTRALFVLCYYFPLLTHEIQLACDAGASANKPWVAHAGLWTKVMNFTSDGPTFFTPLDAALVSISRLNRRFDPVVAGTLDVLLRAGARPDDGNALVKAAAAHYIHCVATLLRYGANPNKESFIEGFRWTVPLNAAMHPSVNTEQQDPAEEVMWDLLARGAHVGAGTTPPLQFSIERSQPRLCRRLLEAGANVSRPVFNSHPVIAFRPRTFHSLLDLAAYVLAERQRRNNDRLTQAREVYEILSNATYGSRLLVGLR